MFKTVFIFLFGLMISQMANALKRDTSLYYLKNSGQVVANKDSADYFRFIMSTDSVPNMELYKVRDFYFTGLPKLIATSLQSTLTPVFDGKYTSFYPNGKQKLIMEYKAGFPIGSAISYYPNGGTYTIIKFDQYHKPDIVECRDSTGKVTLLEGTGHMLIFNEDCTQLVAEGEEVKGEKNGEWHGVINDTAKYVCIFRHDDLKSGTTYTKSGKQYKFTQFEIPPKFDDGDLGFNLFIKRMLVYPEYAKQHHLTGTVQVMFTIRYDGAVTDVKISRGVTPSLDEEALRIMRFSPMWSPCIKYGMPVSVKHTVFINFYL